MPRKDVVLCLSRGLKLKSLGRLDECSRSFIEIHMKIRKEKACFNYHGKWNRTSIQISQENAAITDILAFPIKITDINTTAEQITEEYETF